MEKYRFDQYDSVYEYEEEQGAYVFIGKLNGREKSEFIADHEGRPFDEDEDEEY